MRIGLIQTRGIGDVIIALPIAQSFIEDGHELHRPVDVRFCPFLRTAAPEVNFHPVDPEKTGQSTVDYFYATPLAMLKALGCDRIYSLYSSLSGTPVVDEALARSLKFDEYKYAVTRVPFARKWSLRLRRDPTREQALFDALGVREPYTVVHTIGSDFSRPIHLMEDQESGQIVHLTEKTDNPFDWLLTLERASALMLIDSLYANLVEQLNWTHRKVLLLRSPAPFTPVFKNGWIFR